MLGRFVRVKVTTPIFSTDEHGITYNLNFGEIDFVTSQKREKLKAFVLGINHPVKTFDGRITASFEKNGEKYYVVAPKSKKFIINDVKAGLEFFGPENIQCLYERSCGAIVFRKINEEYRFLVIKNKRSAHWSFPKGHVEMGESDEETAMREVLEETGIHIEIIPGFKTTSEYMIQGKVEKTVHIYVASTNDTNTVIQESEIEDYSWLTFENSQKRLKFENDKKILTDARAFLMEKNLIN
ncbi:MAG: NUDIX domain-containing protein [Oscillospiraceae bacterium]|nr:NUDIX domain-containing protein [Oscillospiraceae bacterium]